MQRTEAIEYRKLVSDVLKSTPDRDERRSILESEKQTPSFQQARDITIAERKRSIGQKQALEVDTRLAYERKDSKAGYVSFSFTQAENAGKFLDAITLITDSKASGEQREAYLARFNDPSKLELSLSNLLARSARSSNPYEDENSTNCTLGGFSPILATGSQGDNGYTVKIYPNRYKREKYYRYAQFTEHDIEDALRIAHTMPDKARVVYATVNEYYGWDREVINSRKVSHGPWERDGLKWKRISPGVPQK